MLNMAYDKTGEIAGFEDHCGGKSVEVLGFNTEEHATLKHLQMALLYHASTRETTFACYTLVTTQMVLGLLSI